MRVDSVVLLCSFPAASLYTAFHGLEPAVWEQNFFQDLSFHSWSFAWYCPFTSWYWSFLSCLRLSSFLVLWYLLLSASAHFWSIVSSLVHQGTLLPLVTRSPALDTLKTASQFAVIMEINFDISSSVSVDCLTFTPISSSHFDRSLELFKQLKLESKFDTSLSSNFPQTCFLRVKLWSSVGVMLN